MVALPAVPQYLSIHLCPPTHPPTHASPATDGDGADHDSRSVAIGRSVGFDINLALEIKQARAQWVGSGRWQLTYLPTVLTLANRTVPASLIIRLHIYTPGILRLSNSSYPINPMHLGLGLCGDIYL